MQIQHEPGFYNLKKETQNIILKKLPGTMGILQTVKFMIIQKEKYRKNPMIRKLALLITKNINKKYNQARAIYNYILKKVKYKSDIIDVETIQSPLITLKYGGGDCDDLSLLAASLLESIGIKTVYVITSYDDLHYTHIYLYFYLNDKKLPFDLTIKRFNYERPYKKKRLLT